MITPKYILGLRKVPVHLQETSTVIWYSFTIRDTNVSAKVSTVACQYCLVLLLE